MTSASGAGGSQGPRFSILTVSFNAVDTIEETIDSVDSQRNAADIEHIVIDGDSSDGTVDVIRDRATALEYWVSERDDGIYDAMNKGIARARGEWIGTLNSDDWYAAGALGHVSTVARRHPDADVIVGGMVRVSDDGRLGKVKPPFRGGFSTLKSNNHPATFVRRRVYESVGCYDTTYTVAADLDWLARAMRDESVTIITTPKVLTYMRGGGASASFVGVFESLRIERAYRGIGPAVAVFTVKLLKMTAYKLAHFLLPKQIAHAAERAFWRGGYDVVELDSR